MVEFTEIEDKHIKRIEELYSGLMWTISYKIGGDRIRFDFDDCFQELRIAAMEALITFRRNQYPELEYDDILEMRGFDAYVKTCLWNRKNKIGKEITKKIINGPIDFSYGHLYSGGEEEVGAVTGMLIEKPQEEEKKDSLMDDISQDSSSREFLQFLIDNVEDVTYLDYSGIWYQNLANITGLKPHQVKNKVDALKEVIDFYRPEKKDDGS